MYHVSAQGVDESMINVRYHRLELSAEPSIPALNTGPRGGHIKSLSGKSRSMKHSLCNSLD